MQMIIIVLIQAYYHEYRNIKHVKGCLNQMFKSIHKHVHYAKCLCSRKFKGNVSSLYWYTFSPGLWITCTRKDSPYTINDCCFVPLIHHVSCLQCNYFDNVSMKFTLIFLFISGNSGSMHIYRRHCLEIWRQSSNKWLFWWRKGRLLHPSKCGRLQGMVVWTKEPSSQTHTRSQVRRRYWHLGQIL